MKHFLRLAAVFCGISILVSCSDSVPSVSSVSPSVVFDYASEDAEPSVRLSLFALAESDFLRASKINVYNENTGLEWECSSLRKISDEGKNNWAGYSNFVSSDGVQIPKGRYSLVYEDASERECEVPFYVNYDSALYESRPKDFPWVMSGNRMQRLAVYDKDGMLLYFGERKNNWSDDKKILLDFANADTFRICWLYAGNTVICMMPYQSLK